MIAYDTNILIYALEGTSDWAAAAQSTVEQGEHDGAVLSVLAWQELMTGTVLKGGIGMEAILLQALHDFSTTRFVPVTQAICERAVALTKRYGKQIYGYDAIHLASALEHKATVFITNDKLLYDLHEVDGLVIRGL
jgi:predicted nucleic acid-binding protein